MGFYKGPGAFQNQNFFKKKKYTKKATSQEDNKLMDCTIYSC